MTQLHYVSVSHAPSMRIGTPATPTFSLQFLALVSEHLYNDIHSQCRSYSNKASYAHFVVHLPFSRAAIATTVLSDAVLHSQRSIEAATIAASSTVWLVSP